MSIVLNTFVFLITIICVIYLALKYKYFKDNKGVITKRRFKNVIDVTLVVSILIFSVMHVNSFINALQNGGTAESYLNYIILCIGVYFIWVFVNVKVYRQELRKAENNKVNKKK